MAWLLSSSWWQRPGWSLDEVVRFVDGNFYFELFFFLNKEEPPVRLPRLSSKLIRVRMASHELVEELVLDDSAEAWACPTLPDIGLS